MPHYYEQRPVRLRPADGRATAPPAKAAPRPAAGLPDEPRHGFEGRARELLRIERELLRGRVVVINGFGGVGKTALAREAGYWLTRTGLYEGACYVSFEAGGGPAALISALARALGVKADAAAVHRKLDGSPRLVIADDLDAVLPGGAAPLESAARMNLWDALLDLTGRGTGLILVARGAALGDGRLAPGARAAHVTLAGLATDEAIALVGRALDDLGVDRAPIDYAALRDLVDHLGGLPLAVQLVAPALREASPRSILDEFDAWLPRLVDPDEPGRNASLVASLDASIRVLSEDERSALDGLAPFDSGACEDDLVALDDSDRPSWPGLRSALLRAGLAHLDSRGGPGGPAFFRLHPALTPFLRWRSDGIQAHAAAAHANHYHCLADALNALDTSDPAAARARVRSDLPNFRRAFRTLLASDLDDAAALLNRLRRFLQIAGRGAEIDALTRELESARVAADTGGPLRESDWEWAITLGRADLDNGRHSEALGHFERLLKRVEAAPPDARVGPRSVAHADTLHAAAHCLERLGRIEETLDRLALAHGIVEECIGRRPDDPGLIARRGALLIDLGDVFAARGDDASAGTLWQQALRVAEWRDDPRAQAQVLERYAGLLAWQGDLERASGAYATAAEFYECQGEPESAAILRIKLGRIAAMAGAAAEAEAAFRASLAVLEGRRRASEAAVCCLELAGLAKHAGRDDEANAWYRRAVSLDPGLRSSAVLPSDLHADADFRGRQVARPQGAGDVGSATPAAPTSSPLPAPATPRQPASAGRKGVES